jgi:protoporphyrinogen oxidase
MVVTRRKFLGGAAAASFMPLGAAARARTDLDVAVVGGGIAGVYTAWRLANAQPDLRIRLFEMSGRIGGRLRSVAFPQAPHLVGELGGMRFLEAQKTVFNLVNHLGLPKRGYPLLDPHGRLALRGRTFEYGALGNPGTLYPYNIPPEEQSPKSKVFIERLARIVPDARTMTAEQWRRVRATVRYKGRLLKDWAAWALLSDLFTHEEMAFAQDSAGYDDIALHETGLEELDFAFMGVDFSKPFYTIVGGYQQLPLALAKELARLRIDVAMDARLASLTTMDGAAGAFRLHLQHGNGTSSTITASRVVLAMPRRALESIDEFPLRRDPPFADLIASVEPVPAAKALLLYPKPWWSALGINGGRSVTDMPARQFYALGAEKERLPSEPADGYGMLMMYCDSDTVEYWKEAAPAARSGDAGFQWLAGDSEFAQEIHREASLVYGVTPPQPLAACFQDWTADPFGGGWHYWGPGKDGLALADRMLKPLPDRDLYICGEAYGVYEPGWVETALERAETMLQRHFGLRPPQHGY